MTTETQRNHVKTQKQRRKDAKEPQRQKWRARARSLYCLRRNDECIYVLPTGSGNIISRWKDIKPVSLGKKRTYSQTQSIQISSVLFWWAEPQRNEDVITSVTGVLQHKEVTDKEGDKTEGPDLTDGAVNWLQMESDAIRSTDIEQQYFPRLFLSAGLRFINLHDACSLI